MNCLQTCCGEFIRTILFVLNFVFWGAGGVILGVGIYIKTQTAALDNVSLSTDSMETMSYILIGLGCVVFAVGLLGCCGSLTQNVCMLMTYFSIVSVIFIGEIALAIVVYVKKDTIADQSRETFRTCMEEYNTPNATEIAKETVDTIQSVLKCCGEDGPGDWVNTTMPNSCCEGDDTCTVSEAYEDGCFTKIDEFVTKNSKFIGIGVLAVAVVELIGMGLACYLRTYISQRDEYQAYSV